jgi:hypothetical protein
VRIVTEYIAGFTAFAGPALHQRYLLPIASQPSDTLEG